MKMILQRIGLLAATVLLLAAAGLVTFGGILCRRSKIHL